MKDKLWLRVLALCLAVACLISIVSAATYTLDLTGDDKVNIWDLQLAVNGSKGTEHETAILEEILGNPDELHPNADGQYEIYTTLGLYNMAKLAAEDDHAKGKTFVLMNNVDMGGVDWAPIAVFNGTLNGNGKTISNVKITKSVAVSDGYNQGFFGTLDAAASVKDLNMEDVTVTISEATADNYTYVGLISGSTRGVVENCTTVGTVNDNRTKLTKASYIGTLVGRVNNNNPQTGKIVSGTTKLTATAGTANADDKVTGLTSKMAMNFATLEAGSAKRNIGIAGYSDTANIDTGMTWQDITNSTELVSETLQERRQKVVDAMYEMGTVRWTPSATMELTYYKTKTGSTSTWTAGKVYYGIPYNHGSSGMDRFLSVMDTKNGIYTTKSSLPTYAYYYSNDTVLAELVTALKNGDSTTASGYVVPEDLVLRSDGTLAGVSHAGFSRYIGNDCSSAAAWAWRQVSAVSGTGFTNPQSTSNMIPTASYVNNAGQAKNGYTAAYGIQPVNGLIFEHPTKDMDGDGKVDTDASQDLNGDGVVNNSDYADMVEAVFASDNAAYWGALAGVSKGDGLVGYNDDGGHTRVAAGDAIVIRNYKGVIQPKLSYIVTHEQGRGSSGTEADGTAWSSNWTLNCKYTFDQLTNYDGYSNIGSACCYFPITITALREENTPAATAWCKKSTAGVVTSNFHIVSTTVGAETVYTGVQQDSVRTRCVSLTLSEVHTGISTGDSVTVLLSNGQTFSFTY